MTAADEPLLAPAPLGRSQRRGSVVDRLEVAVYRIPTQTPEADGTAAWSSTNVVVAIATSGSITGLGWTYGSVACARVITEQLRDIVVGLDVASVPAAWSSMVAAVRNTTRAGVAGYAISAVDVALWDLKARVFDMSLVDLLGAARTDVPIYGSGGFTTYSDDETAAQLAAWVERDNIPRVKIKVGERHGTREDRDLHRIHLAREVIGPHCELYIDANGAYSAQQAVRVMHAAEFDNVIWFEEPVSSDDLAGLRRVRQRIDADVAAGEYGTDVSYVERLCRADAVDCVQIDATRVGGYTEWLRCAAVAAAHHLQVSGHCAPQLHAHVAAATPNLRHLEWFHDHVRIEDILFDGTLDPDDGRLTPGPRSRRPWPQFEDQR